MTEGSRQPTDNRIVLATRNAHKVAELRDILADVLHRTGLTLVGVTDFPDVQDVVETGVTFAANATLKAEAVAALTGLPALGDDSGLAVDVLGGCPGVFSARWSGVTGEDKDRANNELLLSQLSDVPDEHRAAGFVCAAALAVPGRETIVREGQVRGELGRAPRGTNGFGYDPLLVLPDGRTLAEYSAEEKHAISHRGWAFRALAEDIARVLG
ncbi:RdgB/HAM1 family non-canonical purine NTP pyrophosphatase [Ornithinimicrobium sp. F0845]|uniref:RdgB/HAM1 family non-canonical purine NTP pyrophosphatase n=1 Tax=Ornithinimicrobium sp. F0845 TaxID=2926412 RepID=UPI001FF65586|nr:RdgB/HAM1 family non-canonical purine NTP pyrophosphatase [Ornithinimicrobium sp. F0845]MCK0114034.1 RdgB/HAM1 family non-canonical purine NTP pyrophosphatase [Ornithinimicrobium sp. F0845]